MIISKRTLEILKNYATINMGIVINKGNTITTVSEVGSTFSDCTVEEDFKAVFPVYDLNDFLSVVSQFEEPELNFKEKYVEIVNKKGDARSNYYYGSEDMIHTPSAIKKDNGDFVFKKPKTGEKDFSFSLNEKQLSSVIKMLNVMQLQEIVIRFDGKNVEVGAVNSENPVSNNYFIKTDLEVDFSGGEKDSFEIYFNRDAFKLIPLNYDVEISKEEDGVRTACFKGKDSDITYFVAIEEHSTFGE